MLPTIAVIREAKRRDGLSGSVSFRRQMIPSFKERPFVNRQAGRSAVWRAPLRRCRIRPGMIHRHFSFPVSVASRKTSLKDVRRRTALDQARAGFGRELFDFVDQFRRGIFENDFGLIFDREQFARALLRERASPFARMPTRSQISWTCPSKCDESRTVMPRFFRSRMRSRISRDPGGIDACGWFVEDEKRGSWISAWASPIRCSIPFE